MSLRSWRIVSAAVPASESAASGWPMLRTGVLPVEGFPCVLIQMLLSHLRTGSARIAGKRIGCRDLGELLIAIRVESAFDPAVFGRLSRADRTLRRILRADCRHDRMWARKWLRLEVSRCESGTPAFARLSCGFENQQRSENSVPQADHRVVHLTLLIEAGDFQVHSLRMRSARFNRRSLRISPT